MEEKITEEEKEEQQEYERLKSEIAEMIKDKNTDKLTAPELREIAKKIPGVTGAHAKKKDELLNIVKSFLGIKEKKAPKQGKERIGDIKKKIAQLKQEKAKALNNNDKKRASILRRRINRLKKLTRKLAKAA